MARVITDDSSLVEIADAIREKGGTSDALAFPAGFAEAIAAIQTGGGLSLISGEITPSETMGEITITHNLGKMPEIIAFFPDDASWELTKNDKPSPFLAYLFINDISVSVYASSLFSNYYAEVITVPGYDVTTSAVNISTVVHKVNESSFTFNKGYLSANLYAGIKYYWLVG